MHTRTFRFLSLLSALLSTVLFAGTYFIQYVFNLTPCPLCYFQRGILGMIAFLFWFSFLHRCKTLGRFIYLSLIGMLSLAGFMLSIRHIWLQYIAPVSESNCIADFEKMITLMPILEVIKKTLEGSQSCSEIDFTFLNLSLPIWSSIVFLGLMILAGSIFYLQIKRRI